MESVNENLIRDLVCSQRKSYIQVSEILKEMFPGKIVFLRRFVQRYCLERSISGRVKQEEVTTMVARAVNEVELHPNISISIFSSHVRQKLSLYNNNIKYC